MNVLFVLYLKSRDKIRTWTRPEFRCSPVPVPVEFGPVPVPVDLAGTRLVPQFFMLDYRFSLFCTNENCLYHVLPSIF